MAGLRVLSSFPHRRYRVWKISNLQPLRLLLGCGATRRAGWIGVDGVGGKHVDLTLDLRRRLPFKDNSVELCFSEHFLEHLSPEEGFAHLRDVLRILKPGGRYRVVVPHAERFMEQYIRGEIAFFETAFPWAFSPIDAVYHIVNWNGAHRNIFDRGRLTLMARQAGFCEVIHSEANSSELDELRIDVQNPQRIAESLYAELIKAATE